MSETEVLEAASPSEPTDSRLPRPGTEVSRYTIVRLLGRGGMGAVYEARHTRLGRRVSIKFLLPDLAARAEILRRFENEAVAAGGLEHPNLVAVIDLGRATDGAPYLVMEFLEGEDCARLLQRVGPLPAPRAADIVLQACRGVAVAHAAGIIHRDLKPENLFLTDAGDGSDLVKVLDFGIAKLRPSDGQLGTRTGATLGTTHYMSPEQARGAGEVDPRTDVWSLGVVLYELLAGRKPFEGEDFLNVVHQILSVPAPALGSLRPGLPAGLEAVVAKAMAPELGDRFQSIGALADALRPFAAHVAPSRPVVSPSAVTVDSAAPPRSTRPASAQGPPRGRVGTVLAIGVGVVAVIAIGGFGMKTLTSNGPKPVEPPVQRQAMAPVTAPALAAPPAPAPRAPEPAAEAPMASRPAEPSPAPRKKAPASVRGRAAGEPGRPVGENRAEAARERALTLEPNPY